MNAAEFDRTRRCRKVLVLAHPRSGTGYTAACFRAAGWDVGHEKLGHDGIASWMWAVNTPWVPWGDPRNDTPRPEHMVHLLREPRATVLSVAFTEAASEPWRRSHIDIGHGDSIERAIQSIHGWNEIIRDQGPEHTVRLGDVPALVEALTGRAPGPVDARAYNRRKHIDVEPEAFAAMVRTTYGARTRRLWLELVEAYDKCEVPR